jgi:hypothetical protein
MKPVETEKDISRVGTMGHSRESDGISDGIEDSTFVARKSGALSMRREQ